jgi:LysM repeat protein
MLHGMNTRMFAWILPTVALLGVVSVTTLQGSDLAEEYNQVKKIALKDPKVRAAFQRANDELNKRIIEIDPSLKPFVEQQHGPKKKAAQSEKFTSRKRHVVTKGETLTSIARRYHVTVDALVGANHISKQTPLHVGQKLLIPPKR